MYLAGGSWRRVDAGGVVPEVEHKRWSYPGPREAYTAELTCCFWEEVIGIDVLLLKRWGGSRFSLGLVPKKTACTTGFVPLPGGVHTKQDNFCNDV